MTDTMRPYVAPYHSAAECDHQGGPEQSCSHCCPCADCGAERAANESEEAASELRALDAALADPANECDACKDGLPGVLCPAGNDDNHLFVQACDACSSRTPTFGYADFDDVDAAERLAKAVSWNVHRRFDDDTRRYWRPFVAKPGSWDDKDFVAVGGDGFGWSPDAEIPIEEGA